MTNKFKISWKAIVIVLGIVFLFLYAFSNRYQSVGDDFVLDNWTKKVSHTREMFRNSR